MMLPLSKIEEKGRRWRTAEEADDLESPRTVVQGVHCPRTPG